MKKVLYIFVFTLISLSSFAQQIEVNATIDSNSILIGQQAHINLNVTYDVKEGAVNIVFPTIYDTINEFVEIVNKSLIDTVIPDKENPTVFTQSQQITITSFDSGYYAIPPFKFIVNKDTFETEPLLLEVQTVAVDTAQAIFDIKAPLEEPFNFMDWLKENWIWIVGTLGLLILIALIIIYFKNKKPVEKEVEAKPEIPIHVLALEKLESIKRQKLWQDGKVKQYHSEISETLRNYIEERFFVNALEETTNEIMHGLRLQSIDSLTMNKLNQTLVLADLVKFAKEQPTPAENEMNINNAIEFINQTKITINPQEKNVE